MKNFKLILSAVTATFLFGCSDLAVNEKEAYSENMPADFNYQEYVEINPKLHFQIITEAATKHNSDIREMLDQRKTLAKDSATNAAAIAALDSSAQMKAYIADSIKFYQTDSATIHALFLKDWAGALRHYTEADWKSSWDQVAVATKYDTTSKVLDTLRLDVTGIGEGTDTTKIYMDTGKADGTTAKGKITYDENGVITAIDGYTDTLYTEKISVTISETVKVEKMKTKAKLMTRTTVTVDTTVDTTYIKGLDASKYSYLGKFNFIDKVDAAGNVQELDDVAVAEAVKADSTTVTLQYIWIGKVNGWPYRRCKESELNNTRPCEDEYLLCEAAAANASTTTEVTEKTEEGAEAAEGSEATEEDSKEDEKAKIEETLRLCISNVKNSCAVTDSTKFKRYCYDEVGGYAREIK